MQPDSRVISDQINTMDTSFSEYLLILPYEINKEFIRVNYSILKLQTFCNEPIFHNQYPSTIYSRDGSIFD